MLRFQLNICIVLLTWVQNTYGSLCIWSEWSIKSHCDWYQDKCSSVNSKFCISNLYSERANTTNISIPPSENDLCSSYTFYDLTCGERYKSRPSINLQLACPDYLCSYDWKGGSWSDWVYKGCTKRRTRQVSCVKVSTVFNPRKSSYGSQCSYGSTKEEQEEEQISVRCNELNLDSRYWIFGVVGVLIVLFLCISVQRRLKRHETLAAPLSRILDEPTTQFIQPSSVPSNHPPARQTSPSLSHHTQRQEPSFISSQLYHAQPSAPPFIPLQSLQPDTDASLPPSYDEVMGTTGHR